MAICSLMEMQWQHCCYIHSGEYFHGPFEATEPGVFYFVQLGSGECRPMEERALAFLNTHTDTIMVHVRNIREKIEVNPREPKYLKVVWGVGYKIEKQA